MGESGVAPGTGRPLLQGAKINRKTLMPPKPAPGGAVSAAAQTYWRKNLRIMAVLLVIWAAVGLGAGVLFADTLNQWSIGGYPLGFWFAQQGSIIVFVLLILVYALQMNRLDREHHEDLEREKLASRGAVGSTPESGGSA